MIFIRSIFSCSFFYIIYLQNIKNFQNICWKVKKTISWYKTFFISHLFVQRVKVMWMSSLYEVLHSVLLLIPLCIKSNTAYGYNIDFLILWKLPYQQLVSWTNEYVNDWLQINDIAILQRYSNSHSNLAS